MRQKERHDQGKEMEVGPGTTEGGRSPTGVAPGGAVADGAVGPLEPGQRWTARRKRDVVLRVMRGESVEALSRELGLESYRIQDGYERAMAGVDGGVAGTEAVATRWRCCSSARSRRWASGQ